MVQGHRIEVRSYFSEVYIMPIVASAVMAVSTDRVFSDRKVECSPIRNPVRKETTTFRFEERRRTTLLLPDQGIGTQGQKPDSAPDGEEV